MGHAVSLVTILTDLSYRMQPDAWEPVSCSPKDGYPCPRATFGLMAVSSFASNSSLQYAGSALCVTSCEHECIRRPDCVGFSSSQLYLRTGGLLVTNVSARCGPLERACPTTQIIFELSEDGAQCMLAGSPVFVAHGVSIAAERRNCTIAVAVRAKQSDAYFSIPRLDIPLARDSEPAFIPTVVVGAVTAVAALWLVAYCHRR